MHALIALEKTRERVRYIGNRQKREARGQTHKRPHTRASAGDREALRPLSLAAELQPARHQKVLRSLCFWFSAAAIPSLQQEEQGSDNADNRARSDGLPPRSETAV